MSNVNAQTAGTLAFGVTTTSTGNYSPKHVVAVWIEDANGTFVKTLLRNAATRKQYIGTWITKSGENVVDAITGSTLANHNTPLALTWNGTDVNGTLVADGVYKVGIQMAWANVQGPVSYFNITKGTSSATGVTTATTNYTNMSLTWTPSTVGVENNENTPVVIYPNPVSTSLNVNLGSKAENTKLEILNLNGAVVFSKSFENISGIINVDMNAISNGVYIVVINRNNVSVKNKIFVVK